MVDGVFLADAPRRYWRLGKLDLQYPMQTDEVVSSGTFSLVQWSADRKNDQFNT